MPAETPVESTHQYAPAESPGLSGIEAAQADPVPIEEKQAPPAPADVAAAIIAAFIVVLAKSEPAVGVQPVAAQAVVAFAAVPYALGVASYTISACARIFAKFALIAALAPFARAVFSEASTTEAKIPIIATTTKSSINVKPFLKFIFIIYNFIFIIICNFDLFLIPLIITYTQESYPQGSETWQSTECACEASIAKLYYPVHRSFLAYPPSQVVNRHKHRYQENPYPKTKNHYHYRLNQPDQGIYSIINFTFIKFG